MPSPSPETWRKLLIARAVAATLATTAGVGVIIAGFLSHGPHSHLVEIIGLVYVLVMGAMARQHVRAVPRKQENNKAERSTGLGGPR